MFFSDLIDEVYGLLMNGKSEKEVIELLPCIYLENYHFDYGVGKKTYFIEINKFLDSKIIDKYSRVINRRFSLINKDYNLDELVMLLAKYYFDIDKGNKREIKVYRKINI